MIKSMLASDTTIQTKTDRLTRICFGIKLSSLPGNANIQPFKFAWKCQYQPFKFAWKCQYSAFKVCLENAKTLKKGDPVNFLKKMPLPHLKICITNNFTQQPQLKTFFGYFQL